MTKKLEVLQRVFGAERTWYVAGAVCEHCGQQGAKVAEEMSFENAVAVARACGELVNDPGEEAF